MGKVKDMYQDELERIQDNINDYKTSLGAIDDALTILKGVQDCRIVRGEKIHRAIYNIDEIQSELQIALDQACAELDDNPLTTI